MKIKLLNDKCIWCKRLRTRKFGEIKYPYCIYWEWIINYPETCSCFTSIFKKRDEIYNFLKETGRTN